MTTWFKFLAGAATGPFSGFRWPTPLDRDNPGGWVGARQPLEPCRSGLHLCRAADLPFWLHEELYIVEAAGPVVEQDTFVLAARARLLRRVRAWSPSTAYLFACECAWQVRDLTAGSLRAGGRDIDADRLDDCATMDQLLRVAQQATGSDGSSGRLAAYAVDAATFAERVRVGTDWAASSATAAFVAATAAGVGATTGRGAALGDELARQSQWLVDKVLPVSE
jgi:hypothetical protein